jgi:hypothetical protein
MRVASFFVTASVFASLFIGIALVSAVATREIHVQLSSRIFTPTNSDCRVRPWPIAATSAVCVRTVSPALPSRTKPPALPVYLVQKCRRGASARLLK